MPYGYLFASQMIALLNVLCVLAAKRNLRGVTPPWRETSEEDE